MYIEGRLWRRDCGEKDESSTRLEDILIASKSKETLVDRIVDCLLL